VSGDPLAAALDGVPAGLLRAPVTGGGHLPGGLTARCGHLLPTAIHQLDQPPPGPPCEDCRLILLADFALQAAAGGLTDALQHRHPRSRPAAG
jgi:hypothetical protein